MILLGIKHLSKLKKKQGGNKLLLQAIDQLIEDFEQASWKNKEELFVDRNDADCVHSDGFYFFDVHHHRTLVLIEFDKTISFDLELELPEEEGLINIHWVGSHEEYERTFKNNKTVIEKWLRAKGLIE